MEIVRDDEQLSRYITSAVQVSGDSPVLIDQYLSRATEVDVDAVADELFAAVTRPPLRRTPDRLEIVLAVGTAGRARDLAARETECCSFFTFDVREVSDRVVLEVGVPPAQVAVLDAVQARVEAVRSLTVRPDGRRSARS